MAENKKVIVVYKQGKEIGYIKSISYKYNSFETTLRKEEAKKYIKESRIYDELDFLSRFIEVGYNFSYM